MFVDLTWKVHVCCNTLKVHAWYVVIPGRYMYVVIPRRYIRDVYSDRSDGQSEYTEIAIYLHTARL